VKGDRIFLDANVLVSAAWSDDNALTPLWRLPGIELVTSIYASEEATRNLHDPGRKERLAALLGSVTLVGDFALELAVPASVPAKDRPIIGAAIAARATHLLTGDKAHFRHCFGKEVCGVRVLRPAAYLRRKRRATVAAQRVLRGGRRSR
jgi:predicted nucleic acid-binding protein